MQNCRSSVQDTVKATMNKDWYRKGTLLLAEVASPVAKLASQESSSSVSPLVALGVEVAVAVAVELVEESLDAF
ncbi:hypothetical protein Cni_G14642 [Canna indica]|uniref:Uncharacterized protein n=1 Tax=Canna indica TaxID=4628 RepID=A0AAQ3QDW9_9LILI|nr:hypothetical protein Cni_G14642 [Canna indica]